MPAPLASGAAPGVASLALALALALALPLALGLAGCSPYWPLSEDLEERIREEEAALTPAIGDHEAVEEAVRAAAEGRAPRLAEVDLPAQPTLDDYVRIALQRSPRVAARVRSLEALGLRVPQVTSLEDPMLTVTLPTDSMTQTAAGMMEGGIGLSQQIPFPSKLAARGRLAEEMVRMGLEGLREARLDVVSKVKSAYYGLYLTTRSIDVTQESQRLLERIRGVADGKFRAGTAPQQDVLRAEVELYELSNALLTLEVDRRTAVALLNVLMDREIDAALPPPASLDPEDVDWRLEQLLARAEEGSPALLAMRAAVRRDLEAMRLARLEYLPDFTVGGAYTFIGGGISPVANGEDVWDIGIGMTLPIWFQRIRAAILERNAEALAGTLEYRARRNELFFAIQEALGRVDSQHRSAILLRDAILPRARQTVDVSETGYQSGQVDFLTWIDNWKRLLAFTLEYHAALASLERSFADLESLAGGALARSAAAEESGAPGQGALSPQGERSP